MSEYIVQGATLDSLAQRMIAMTGDAGKKTLAQMGAIADAVVSETSVQADLLEQIIAELEGKAAGGGSGGDIVISTENLADPAGIVPGKYISGTSEVAYIGWSITAYIPVTPGKYYTVNSLATLDEKQYSGFYDENKSFIRAVRTTDFIASRVMLLTAPEGARYVRFSSGAKFIDECRVYEVTGVEVDANVS